ncbi:MAG: hypothetical protein QG602_2203 [Verrucomicrobiota bacterium]|nr:hypothetical protein [Verrucomicrobiota bacterium]
MKSLFPLPLCCVAVAASAAGLKHPEQFAREWDRTVEEAKQTVVASTLSGQTTHRPKFTEVQPVFFGPGQQSISPPAQPGPRYDAPGLRRHRQLPHDRPAGAMPWEYKSETNWLVPLAPGNGR